MNETLLRVEHLRVQYGRFLAVDDVTFEMSAGHLLGMIGPNGAGKTTTLRAAAGLQPVSTGQVRILGHDVSRHATVVGHHLAFVADTPAGYDTLTVEDFLRFIGACYSLPTSLAEERIAHWLENLWLTDKRKAKVGTLSRGMRQRLGVARALLPDPHVVLMDEPAAGLDPAGRVHFRRLLASLRDQGKAIIVSSHILADLAEYCTHIAIMERGRFLRYGTVAEVTGHAEQARCNYRIVLAQTVGDAAVRLNGLPGASHLQINNDTILLEYDSDRRAAAALLAALVAAGLPVAEFQPMRPDLEQAYLRSGIGQVD